MTSSVIPFLIPALPEIFLLLSAMALLVAGAFGARARFTGWASVCACVLAAAFLLGISWDRTETFGGMFVLDGFAAFVKLLLLVGLGSGILLSFHYHKQHFGNALFEYPVLILLSGVGMMLMVSASDLLALYLAMELQSLALYVLVAIRRDSARSAEAGLKYFVLGALASGMLLFGASLIYGYTGHTRFEDIAGALGEMPLHAGVLTGLVCLLAGFAFKLSLVPFHMWTPDVYEGAPTPVTALLALAPKIAAFALLMRVLFEPFGDMSAQWGQILWFLAAASMIVGAFGGLMQGNIKRILAYSTIGHMGTALVGVCAGTAEGVGAVLVYLSIYMVMSAGVFGIVLCMRREGMDLARISDLAGFSRHFPVLGAAMAVLMFSMTGLPPLAGFFGKLFVFQAAVEAGLVPLVVIGVLCSVVAAYYYLRIVKVMYFDDPVESFDRVIPFERRALIFASLLFVLLFIVKPDLLLGVAYGAAGVLFGG